MSLERKDIRFKLDHDVHQALVAICDARGVEIAAFVESLVLPEVKRVVHEANVISARAAVSGTSGKYRA